MRSATYKRLSDVPLHKPHVIHGLNGHPETCQRLRDLGMAEHTVVRAVLHNPSLMICELHNTRLALHRRVADTIVVSPVAPDKK